MFTLQAGKQHGVASVAPTIPSRRTAGGGFGTDFDCDGGLIARQWPADVAPTLDAHFGDKLGQENQHVNGGCGLFVPAAPFFATSGQSNAAFAENIALALNATHDQPYIAGTLRTRRPGETGQGADVDLVVPVLSPALNTVSGSHHAPDTRAYVAEVAHSLRADGFDASEDGTGRGTQLVPVTHALDSYSAGRATEDGTGRGCPLVPVAHAFDARQSDVLQHGDQTGPLDTHGSSIGVLLGGLDYENNAHGADEPTGPLLKGSPTGGGRPLPAVAFAQNTCDEVREMPVVGALAAEPGMKQTSYIRQHMAVRRLTPRECERLQGFPDDFTAVPYRGKSAADGPRYKALGNSMAVPVMGWIGKRIKMVEEL